MQETSTGAHCAPLQSTFSTVWAPLCKGGWLRDSADWGIVTLPIYRPAPARPQSLRHGSAVPPPFTQGRLLRMSVNSCGRALCAPTSTVWLRVGGGARCAPPSADAPGNLAQPPNPAGGYGIRPYGTNTYCCCNFNFTPVGEHSICSRAISRARKKPRADRKSASASAPFTTTSPN